MFPPGQLKAVLAAQLARVEALQKRLGRIVPSLFPYLSGEKRAGARRRDFRRAWTRVCLTAGVPGRYRNDFRRTAVRNMEQTGFPRSVALELTGHKTENVDRGTRSSQMPTLATLRDASPGTIGAQWGGSMLPWSS